MLEDDELFCHECGTKQEIEEYAKNKQDANKCIHCGKIIENIIVFCPYCGEKQKGENEVDISSETLSGLKELVDIHMKYVKENPHKKTETNIVFKSNWVKHCIKILTTKEGKTQLSVTLDFNKTQEKIIYNRLKQKDYFPLFKSNKSLENGYQGYLEFEEVADKYVFILSSLLTHVFKYDYVINADARTSALTYHIIVDGN